MRGNIEIDADVLQGILKGVLGKKAAQELDDKAGRNLKMMGRVTAQRG